MEINLEQKINTEICKLEFELNLLKDNTSMSFEKPEKYKKRIHQIEGGIDALKCLLKSLIDDVELLKIEKFVVSISKTPEILFDKNNSQTNYNELEYRIKLNMLRAKYSKDAMDAIALCIDSAITCVEFMKQQYRDKRLSKLPSGGVVVGDNNKPEIITKKHT